MVLIYTDFDKILPGLFWKFKHFTWWYHLYTKLQVKNKNVLDGMFTYQVPTQNWVLLASIWRDFQRIAGILNEDAQAETRAKPHMKKNPSCAWFAWKVEVWWFAIAILRFCHELNIYQKYEWSLWSTMRNYDIKIGKEC